MSTAKEPIAPIACKACDQGKVSFQEIGDPGGDQSWVQITCTAGCTEEDILKGLKLSRGELIKIFYSSNDADDPAWQEAEERSKLRREIEEEELEHRRQADAKAQRTDSDTKYFWQDPSYDPYDEDRRSGKEKYDEAFYSWKEAKQAGLRVGAAPQRDNYRDDDDRPVYEGIGLDWNLHSEKDEYVQKKGYYVVEVECVRLHKKFSRYCGKKLFNEVLVFECRIIKGRWEGFKVNFWLNVHDPKRAWKHKKLKQLIELAMGPIGYRDVPAFDDLFRDKVYEARVDFPQRSKKPRDEQAVRIVNFIRRVKSLERRSPSENRSEDRSEQSESASPQQIRPKKSEQKQRKKPTKKTAEKDRELKSKS